MYRIQLRAIQRVGLAVALMLTTAVVATAEEGDFRSQWQTQPDRVWVGPEYWSNPLQDWRLRDGRLECIAGGPNRNVHLLTRQLSKEKGDLQMSVRIEKGEGASRGHAGFRVGIRGTLDDYRNACIHGRGGIDAGLGIDGTLFIGQPDGNAAKKFKQPVGPEVDLKFTAQPADNGYTLTLAAHDPQSGEQLAVVTREGVSGNQLVGNLALVSHAPGGGRGTPRFRFSNWAVAGSKVETHDDRSFGPILFSQYTLSRNVMKMTAQMAPVGVSVSPPLEGGDQGGGVILQIRPDDDADWKTVGKASIDPLSRTATFRIENWDSSRDVPYRLVYSTKKITPPVSPPSQRGGEHYWTGTVRRDPVDKETVVVAGFTGNKDTGFPNNPTVRNVGYHDPDILVFTGDQIYEDVAGYGVRRTDDVELASLDYLRKWYLVGWSFGDLMRDRPTICLPDDHDVYQPNIWGGGGRSVPTMAAHPQGGYFMPPEWVNAVQRTQCAHLPDPYDPTPVAQGITVYYTDMNYGRVSIAVIEDRKFKSGPEGLCPPTKSGRPDHIVDPEFDPQTVDLPEAKLLGDRQLKFLREWAADWRNADMKMVASQTIFNGVPNYHGANLTKLVADLDSNGWPQTPRNEALEEMRKGFAFHLGGDQHLPLILQYGINDFGDAPFTFCVPSISAGYPRAFRPDEPGRNRQEGMPFYTGQFHDGLGNKMTVWAVANPKKDRRRDNPLTLLHDKASGYGIVRLHKETGKITIECWPLLADPSDPENAEQFPGWPKTIDMQDNYGRDATGWLPTVEVTGMQNPVIQVIDEQAGEIVYTLRIRGTRFRPKVFRLSTYCVKVGEPGTDRMKILSGLRPTDETDKTIRVEF